jgi:tetratricopeptide (TPR) repeat protein
LTQKFRERTYGRDLRLEYPEKKVLDDAIQRALKFRQGQVIFLAGPRLSGRSDMLQTLGDHIRQYFKKIDVCASRFSVDGKLEDIATNRDVKLKMLSKGLGVVGDILPETVAKWIKKTNALLIGYLEGKHALPAKEAGALLWQSIDRLKEYLMEMTSQRPLLWLIDDFDLGPIEFNEGLLYELRPQLSNGLPVIFFLTVNYRTMLEKDPGKTDRLQTVAGSLIENNVGQWWPIRPLSKKEISDWLGDTGPGIIETLLQTTEGYPPRVIETWYLLQKDNYVSFSQVEGRWTINPHKPPSLNPVRNLTDAYLREKFADSSSRERDKYRQILHLCALEGESFNADCVAAALEYENEEFQDLLDDHFVRSDENPDGLLLESELYEFKDKFGNEQEAWRYRFADTFTWLALENDDDTRLHQQRYQLAMAIRGLYNETEPQIARLLARIYEIIGAEDQARHFKRIFDYGDQIDRLVVSALHVIDLMKQIGVENDHFTSQGYYDLLLAAGRSMMNTYPFRETFKVFYFAAKIAERATDKTDLVEAYYYCGQMLGAATRHRKARDIYNKARSQINCLLSSTSMIKKISGRLKLKKLDSLCLYGLAETARMQAEYDAASSFYRLALGIAREINDRDGESSCLYGLAEIALMEGEDDTASSLYDQALEIAREIGDRGNEVCCLNGLATLMQADSATATSHYRQALEIAREINDRSGEARALNGLGDISRMQAEYDDASSFYRQALEIVQEINDLVKKVLCLIGLAEISRMRGEYDSASSLYRQALKIAQKINDRGGEAGCLKGLAEIAQMQSESNTASALYHQRLEIYELVFGAEHPKTKTARELIENHATK